MEQYSGSSVTTSNRRFLHANHQGSIIAHSDASGNATVTNAYDALGILEPTNEGRFGYTGQVWLPELGLYHYKARMYEPRLGRFLQTDPVGYEDQMNPYAYVGKDPINMIDPTSKNGVDTLPDNVEDAQDKLKDKAKDKAKEAAKGIAADEMREKGMSEDQICRALECSGNVRRYKSAADCAAEKCSDEHFRGGRYPYPKSEDTSGGEGNTPEGENDFDKEDQERFERWRRGEGDQNVKPFE